VGRGRPGKVLQLAVHSNLVAGFKVRDFRITGTLTNMRAQVLAERELSIVRHTPEKVVESVKRCLDMLLVQSSIPRQDLLGVGVGFSGLVDIDRGVLESSPFLGWQDVRIRQLLAEALGLPVFIDNDVNTLALAELWFGDVIGARDSLIVTTGQGIGLSVIKKGRVLRIPGELGHTQVSSSAKECVCGNIGCLEATAGESALLESANQLFNDRPLKTASEVYELALTDPRIQKILDLAAEQLGRGLANMINIFRPTTVFLAGEGLAAGDYYARKVEQTANTRCHPSLRGSYRFAIHKLPDVAWARGAASLVLHAVFDDDQFSELQEKTHLKAN
jgi:predicted NBD/HSP70 family sugar kinase